MSAVNTNLNEFGLSINSDSHATSQNNVYTLTTTAKYNLVDHEVGLKLALIEYQIPNISVALGNNLYQYVSWDGVTKSGDFLPSGESKGIFSIEDLNESLHTTMRNNNDYLLDADGYEVYYLDIYANSTVNKFQIVSTQVPTSLPSGYSYPPTYTIGATPNLAPSGLAPPAALSGTSTNMQLVILSNYLQTTLGFDAGSYPSTRVAGQLSIDTLSTSTPQLTDVTNLTIRSNLCGGSDTSSIPNLLATVRINGTPGGDISYEPVNYMWRYIPQGVYNQFTLRVCDQNGDDIDFIGNPTMSFELMIQKRRRY